jgi:hypothetical protein
MNVSTSEPVATIRTSLVFAAVSAGLLLFKLAVTHAALAAFSPYISYFIAHVVVFFASYAGHLKVTFRQSHTWERLKSFFRSVLVLKLVDYFLFSVVLEASGERVSIGVVAASLGVALLRLSVFKKVFTSTSG